jgi:cyclic beta-1,2-glucan synthetase
MGHVQLQGRTGAGLDPCVALQVVVEIGPEQRVDVTALLGEAATVDEARTLARKYRENLAVTLAFEETRAWWDRHLGTIEVAVPERSANPLLNRWLLYQTLACRMMGRSGFYQSGGAYGFRDQLQDAMALLHAAPELARAHIVRAARRQFRAGDVQHWWHPPSGAGVRTRISDDLLWLPYVVAQYVQTTGDATVLRERLPFIEGRHLDDAEHEAYLVPTESLEHASLYEHCRRAIEKGATSGAHGLPLIGTGDWNDGLNRVGIQGQGESVWLAWFLVDTLNRFAELASRHGEPKDAATYRAQAARYAEAVEEHGWDGDWYRRATFDDGTPIGSVSSVEAQIDSLPQSWAWLSGAADPERAARALESAWARLVLPEDKLALLFTPPFDQWDLNPGYIKGYPPGVRENGGQYTHGAVWLAMALARSGDGRRAVDLLQMLNPIEHALDAESVGRYQVEPYVVAADVYRLPGRIGRGGWTWYTGAAGWMYRAWIEEVLGLRVRGEILTVDPVVPADWDRFTVRYRRGEAIYEIAVENPDGVERGVVAVELDGRPLDVPEIPLESGAIKHRVTVRMGQANTT